MAAPIIKANEGCNQILPPLYYVIICNILLRVMNKDLYDYVLSNYYLHNK